MLAADAESLGGTKSSEGTKSSGEEQASESPAPTPTPAEAGMYKAVRDSTCLNLEKGDVSGMS